MPARVGSSLIMIQSSTDLAGLSIALEQQRRLTGRYPDSLEGMAASFSGVPPRQIQSAEPYNYQRTDDGGYRLWGDGLPGLNDTEKMRRGLIIVRPPPTAR